MASNPPNTHEQAPGALPGDAVVERLRLSRGYVIELGGAAGPADVPTVKVTLHMSLDDARRFGSQILYRHVELRPLDPEDVQLDHFEHWYDGGDAMAPCLRCGTPPERADLQGCSPSPSILPRANRLVRRLGDPLGGLAERLADRLVVLERRNRVLCSSRDWDGATKIEGAIDNLKWVLHEIGRIRA